MNENTCMGSVCAECSFRSSIFSILNDEQLDQLTINKTFNFAKKNEAIAKQGNPVKGAIFLRVGLAKLTRVNPVGREQIIGIATPNDFVGLLSIFSSKNYKYNIIAIEDCQYCCVDYTFVMDLINTNSNFAMTLLEKISQVSDLMMGTRLDLEMRQLRGRVAFILSYLSKEIYKSAKFNLPISRREIAELVDMRVENVVRILSEFRRDNIIRIEGTGIEIVEPEKLEWIKMHG